VQETQPLQNIVRIGTQASEAACSAHETVRPRTGRAHENDTLHKWLLRGRKTRSNARESARNRLRSAAGGTAALC